MNRRQESDRNLEQAMDFLMRARDAPEDRALRHEVEAWLARDPAHETAWNKARRAWDAVGQVPPVTADAWTPPASGPDRLMPRARKVPTHLKPGNRRRVAVGAVMALAACVVLAFLAPLDILSDAQFATRTGEAREIVLADGSIVQLAPESAFDADMSDGHRRIHLRSGEAFFDVVADKARPFVVSAGDMSVRVVGTAFDVRVSDEAVSVGVVHGRVAVENRAASLDELLGPGDWIKVSRRSGSITPGRATPGDIASWREGQLFFENATIAEVVAEMRRYQKGWIVIAGGELADKRVTGLYDVRDLDRALAAVVRPSGGNVRRVSPYLRILTAF